MNSKVSVCIPTYNGEKYIEETIKSVLNQSYENIEIIIVDDCSKDNTIDIIRKYKNDKIKLKINEKNLGMIGNWNKCFEYATGEYILFLFQDDIIAEEDISKKVEILDNNNDVVLVFSATSVIDEEGKEKLKRRSFKKDTILDGNNIINKAFSKKNIFGEPSNVMYRTEICKKVGFFNKELIYTPDWEYSLRACQYGKIAYIDKVLTYFRISKTSMTGNLLKNKNRIMEDDDLFIKSITNVFGDKIKKSDIFKHKFYTKIRTYMKIIFCKLFI